ncbi:MAG: shikimate kinase [Eubacterium sp.]|nr:shikimate kinase [Eubacterium sp.]
MINNESKKDNIVFIGMPTSGKSTVGVIVAKILGMDFVDADIVIQKAEGQKLSEIISDRGVDGFLECEERAILGIDTHGAVIATGGSAVYSAKAMEHLAQRAVIVYLDVEKEELFGRLRNVKERGVVLREGETLDDMYDTRLRLYEKYADVKISERGSTLEDTVGMVIDALQNAYAGVSDE